MLKTQRNGVPDAAKRRVTYAKNFLGTGTLIYY